MLLDEVLCGLTPSEIHEAVALIRRIRDQGATIVFVEHVMRAVMALTDRIVVFNQGELLAEGAANDVMQRPDVMTAYLGNRRPCLKYATSTWPTAPRRRCGAFRCDVRQGELLCVVGPNGAGKTTLINAIAGMHRVARRPHDRSMGTTSRGLRRIASARPASPSCRKAGACSPGMTVLENLELGSYLPRAKAAAQGVARRGAGALPGAAGEAAPARPASSRAASSRWSRSPAR